MFSSKISSSCYFIVSEIRFGLITRVLKWRLKHTSENSLVQFRSFRLLIFYSTHLLLSSEEWNWNVRKKLIFIWDHSIFLLVTKNIRVYKIVLLLTFGLCSISVRCAKWINPQQSDLSFIYVRDLLRPFFFQVFHWYLHKIW